MDFEERKKCELLDFIEVQLVIGMLKLFFVSCCPALHEILKSLRHTVIVILKLYFVCFSDITTFDWFYLCHANAADHSMLGELGFGFCVLLSWILIKGID